MSTNSRIGVEKPGGSIVSIFCHWDGYPEHNGKILIENYKTYQKIFQLIQLGNLSVLGSELGNKVDFNSFDYNSKQCLAYGRDRGEKGAEAIIHPDIDDFLRYSEEYNYLFRAGEWWIVEGKNNFKAVTSVLKEIKKENKI